MNLRDGDVKQFAEADRREVNPPMPVETATWSAGGTLDWWVKERREWFGRGRGKTNVSVGSELLIFVPRMAVS
jgi:hypothetical protein